MSITRRLFSPFKRQVPTSAYVYMPPKHTWWKAIGAFAAGGICVFALVRSPAGPQAAPEVSRSAAVAAAASQASSPPKHFWLRPPNRSRRQRTLQRQPHSHPRPRPLPRQMPRPMPSERLPVPRIVRRPRNTGMILRSRHSRVISTRFRAATADQAVAIAAGALATDITQIN